MMVYSPSSRAAVFASIHEWRARLGIGLAVAVGLAACSIQARQFTPEGDQLLDARSAHDDAAMVDGATHLRCVPGTFPCNGACLAACGRPSSPAPGTMVGFPIPPSSQANTSVQIVAGPDGNLWFTREPHVTVDRLTPSGDLKEFSVPAVWGIAVGWDGNLWFTEGNDGSLIGRIMPSGGFTEFRLPSMVINTFTIVAGADGNMWFYERLSKKLCNVTPDGTITALDMPANAGPIGMGPDNNLWFVRPGYLGRITATGDITEFPVSGNLAVMAAGPDGYLWFVDTAAKSVVRMSVDGVVSGQFPIATANCTSPSPNNLVLGSDGALWMTQRFCQSIMRVSLSGEVTEFSTAGISTQPYWIATGPDGNMWFTDYHDFNIGRLTP